MERLTLKDVTVVAVSSIKMEETVRALEESIKNIDFYDVVLISDKKPACLSKKIKFKECKPLKSIEDYNRFMLYDLHRYIDSSFALVVQYDGYVLRPDKWNDIFLNYDYVGAPWRNGYYFLDDGTNIQVGNGGFSLRSKKLLNIFNNLCIAFKNDNIANYNEDGVICLYCRRILERNGIKFAPFSVASMFSCEEVLKDCNNESFGFHLSKIGFMDKIKIIIRKILIFFHIKIFFYSDNIVLLKNKK